MCINTNEFKAKHPLFCLLSCRKDMDSTRQQVELLEDSFLYVRKPLEEGNKKGLEAFAVNS